MQVVQHNKVSAIVEVDAWSFAVSGSDEYDDSSVDASLVADGLCGSSRSFDDYEGAYDSNSGCVLNEPGEYDAASILVDEGWRGPWSRP